MSRRLCSHSPIGTLPCDAESITILMCLCVCIGVYRYMLVCEFVSKCAFMTLPTHFSLHSTHTLSSASHYCVLPSVACNTVVFGLCLTRRSTSGQPICKWATGVLELRSTTGTTTAVKRKAVFHTACQADRRTTSDKGQPRARGEAVAWGRAGILACQTWRRHSERSRHPQHYRRRRRRTLKTVKKCFRLIVCVRVCGCVGERKFVAKDEKNCTASPTFCYAGCCLRLAYVGFLYVCWLLSLLSLFAWQAASVLALVLLWSY